MVVVVGGKVVTIVVVAGKETCLCWASLRAPSCSRMAACSNFLRPLYLYIGKSDRVVAMVLVDTDPRGSAQT